MGQPNSAVKLDELDNAANKSNNNIGMHFPDRQFSALPKFGSIIKYTIMSMSCGINEMCAQLLVY